MCCFSFIEKTEETGKSIFEVNITPFYFDDVLKLESTWLTFIIISFILTTIVLVLIICCSKRIQIATQLIQQGAKVKFCP